MLYKHRIVHAVEAMITDILALANPTFCYRGADGKPISLTEAAGGAKPSEEGLRLRLAALAACGIASARQSTELQLPRLLYTGRS